MKYQDYVIKDGKLIGKFEEMYNIFDDPWEQSTRELYSNEKIIGLEILKKNNHSNVLELGCGLGHYTNRINNVVSKCTGIDISETAINKAKKNYPNCTFITSDILNEDLYKNIDCVMMVEITWYVLEKLKDFKKIISNYKNIGFFHTLNTYPEKEQKYGNEYFTNHLEIINFFSDTINIEEHGVFCGKEFPGCSRTFFYGKVK